MVMRKLIARLDHGSPEHGDNLIRRLGDILRSRTVTHPCTSFHLAKVFYSCFQVGPARRVEGRLRFIRPGEDARASLRQWSSEH